MEVKVNKEIRDYTESIYFGLSLRQFIFSILSCVIAIFLYFILRPFLGIETLSWLCILGATPCAAIGFVKYNGMNAEELIKAFIKSEFLIPKELTFKPRNMYYELLNKEGVSFVSAIETFCPLIFTISFVSSNIP